jgi:general secretion pathway protein C
VLRRLAEPEHQRRLRQVLLVLLALWALAALARLLWVFAPGGATALEAPPRVINPVVSGRAAPAGETVDIERLVGWHLFGEANALSEAEAAAAAAELAAQQSVRDGIEDGARETRLDLELRGIVSSTADGLGRAIIEHRKRQEVYAVEDKLPVSGRVFLAKVMPDQVVLDNSGTYELLKLYEDSELGQQAPAAEPPRRSTPVQPPPTTRPQPERRPADDSASKLASDYRSKLYENPQSLAQVVQVSAVREEGKLLGYRIQPGRDAAQFSKLGFRSGDLVVGVNGIALDKPANTMRLYQLMRNASEAVFDLRRGDTRITLSVDLGSEGNDLPQRAQTMNSRADNQ